MPTHQQFAEDLALYALGELDDRQSAEFREHLSECPSCSREYQQLQDDFSLLAVSVTGSTPPAKSRERLMGAVAREPRMRQARMVPSRPRWWSLAPVFASAVLAASIFHFGETTIGRAKQHMDRCGIAVRIP